MASYRRKEEDEQRSLSRCATCDAMVFAEIACGGRANADTVCAVCGMTIADLPFEGCDYFDLIMRVGRPGHAARPRRSG
jgi:hypothetical protein